MKKCIFAFVVLCACQSGGPTTPEDGTTSSSCSASSVGGFGGEQGVGGQGGNACVEPASTCTIDE